ncbi:SDR family oxidoreductase [Polynucleobacter sp. MG-27-Goln-C1]|uniref:SDR family oxidoreductase n=1 Tax=Polynucleobacter sp. MG-27-Goln-C1 TaxID=1819726 RepID=UPI002105DF8A|nr:SDR family oxidoreductase [Polynucleobacter sp. MG-27-Goln-C1]
MLGSNNSLLVTGSSRGLGMLLAETYLSMGMKVFGCSRNASTIEHQNYRHFVLDISDEASIISMFKEISLLKIRLDLVINNAGMTQSSLGILTRAKAASEIINTNILGTFLITREALKLMQRQHYGRIVNFSSINVPLGSVGSSIYNASKAAMESMATTLSRENAKADITINTIGLSVVDKTGMSDSLTPKALAEKQRLLIKPDLIKVEEIIHAINFLASPLSKNICAQTIYFGGA